MKKILITGLAGSGKSTLAKLMSNEYETYDIETIEGIFHHVDRDTHEEVVERDPNSIHSANHTLWECDLEQLKELFVAQQDEVALYFGVGSNIKEIAQLFDQVIVLSATKEEIQARLSERHPGEYGQEPEVQKLILEGKEAWEDSLRNDGAAVISELSSQEEVVQQVVATINQSA